MKSAVKLSSSIYKYVIRSPSNIHKFSHLCPSKCLLNHINRIQICDNLRHISSANEVNEPHSTKNSPSWKLKDDKSFNNGTIVAGVATALCVSAVIYHKFSKDIKAETGKTSLHFSSLQRAFFRCTRSIILLTFTRF